MRVGSSRRTRTPAYAAITGELGSFTHRPQLKSSLTFRQRCMQISQVTNMVESTTVNTSLEITSASKLITCQRCARLLNFIPYVLFHLLTTVCCSGQQKRLPGTKMTFQELGRMRFIRFYLAEHEAPGTCRAEGFPISHQIRERPGSRGCFRATDCAFVFQLMQTVHACNSW